MDFFTTEDLKLVSKWGSVDYDKSNTVHAEAGEQLKKGPFSKTKYWCESAAKRVGMESNAKKNWLKKGGERGWRFRPYAWGRIYAPESLLTEVYFTIGINTTETEDPFLQFKIDYQFETPEELNERQLDIAHSLTRTESGYKYRKKISLDELENYDWNQLVAITANFIYDHELIYEDIVDAVINERESYFTRICWNTNGWTEPSGRKGKSTNKNTFEGFIGLGIDEWLFSDQLKVGNYQYGYLEAKNLSSKDSPIDIDLFTLENTPSSTIPYYVGHLKNVEILDGDTASQIQEELSFRNEVLSRINEKKTSDKIKKKFSDLFEVSFINIRFKVTDVTFPDNDQLPRIDLDTNRYHRYELYSGTLNAKGFDQAKEDDGNKLDLGDTGRSRGNTGTSTGTRTPGSYEISNWHAQISKQLEKYLNTIKSSRDAIIPERELGRRSIDLVHEKRDEIIYYEIKTHSARKGIRAALGQLLEYAYWKRNKHEKRLKLVIVTPNEVDRFTERYMAMLKERFELPIYYQQFDLDTGELKEEV
ncbi:hypothetical protein SAMN05443144_12085 [Fodinibius roseus]|uniref:Uncharacterized protein n=1 Tax=Fodinibius roseus TaxID=1194090 RepID=A0A1M5HM57_9BACT|nr:hypothetical protein [Fodinibius roseus]SHG17033.1 hypothetical protein SAMN05443144_12085 [Fodinibius roseus]